MRTTNQEGRVKWKEKTQEFLCTHKKNEQAKPFVVGCKYCARVFINSMHKIKINIHTHQVKGVK